MKFETLFFMLLAIIIIFTGCNSTRRDVDNNTIKITQNDEKVILEYLDTKTDDIAYPSKGNKTYSAFNLLGTDIDKIYI
jgi:hypothetical protein